MRACLLVCLLVACGPKRDSSTAHEPPAAGTGEKTTTEVVTGKDGKKYIVTHTTKTIPAAEPPDRPADAYPSDPLVKYNVDGINAYRKKHGRAPLKYDAKISIFATEGSKQLAVDHKAHNHFNAKIKSMLSDPEAMKGKSGFGSRGAENQGDWEGIPRLAPDKLENGKQQIDITLKLMMDEGPGGGHYENMINPKFRRVGIGLVYVGDKLYMTNDFSD
jgi:uncharacterized protein YkwD